MNFISQINIPNKYEFKFSNYTYQKYWIEINILKTYDAKWKKKINKNPKIQCVLLKKAVASTSGLN